MARLSKIPHDAEALLPSKLRNSKLSSTTIEEDAPSSDYLDDETDGASPTAARQERGIKHKIADLGRRSKHGTKKLLHIDTRTEDSKLAQNGIVEELDNNPAFNPQKIFEEEPISVGSTLDKALGKARVLTKVVTNPKDSARHKVAKKLAIQDTPYLSQQADATLLHAHEGLSQAETTQSDEDAEDHIQHLRAAVDGLEEHREAMKVAWTTSRFVKGVKAVPERPYSYPRISDYREQDQSGTRTSTRWPLYIAHWLRYRNQDYNVQYIDEVDSPAFDRETLTLHLERCITSSDPWQAWLMRLRKLSRWEEPKKSVTWFGAWILIWYCNRVVSFIMFWGMFIVIRNRLKPTSHQSLKESHARALDRSANALKFGEHVNMYGRAKWLDPMIEQCGPVLQMQLGDIADHLEVMVNFYEWKSPRNTMFTLILLATMIALGNITNTDWSMRVLTLMVIVYFFLGRPVASLHPKYRHCVIFMKWFVWDIPTHAEWSFTYLNDKARKTRDETVRRSTNWGQVAAENKQSDPVKMNDIDVHTFNCSWRGIPGTLILSLSGLRFHRNFPTKRLWDHSFVDLRELKKVDGKAIKSLAKLQRPKKLIIITSNSSRIILEDMKKRDEAFNMLIGFSGLRWKQSAMSAVGEEHDRREMDCGGAQASAGPDALSEHDSGDDYYDAE